MRAAALLFALLATACGDRDRPKAASEPSGDSATSNPSGASTTAPGSPSGVSTAGWPTLDPLPPLANHVARGKESGRLVAATRLLVPKLTPLDPVGLVLLLEAAGEKPVTKEHPLAEKRFEIYGLVGSLGLRIKAPDGKERSLALAPASKQKGWNPRLLEHEGLGLSFGPAGVFLARERFDWAEPQTALFAGPGKYVLRVTGKLELEGADAIPFESAELAVEVVAASATQLSLADVEAKAAADVAARMSLDEPPSPSKLTMEDAAGNRVVRFSLRGNRNDLTFLEVVVSRAGELRSVQKAKIFTCVAEGTPIATQGGDRAVEDLHAGDAVWALDTVLQRRTVAHVRGSVRAYAPATLEIGPRLRTTPEHPVFAGGAFVDARSLSTGDVLLDERLSPWPLRGAPEPRGAAWVVELSVGPPHTYFAGGLLVHNKSAATRDGMAAGRDTWASVDFRAGTGAKR